MQCNCLTEMPKKLTTFLAPKISGPIKSIECSIQGFCFGEGVSTVLLIPFTVKAEAAGYRSEKGKPVSMQASFCPFCGTPTKEPEAVAEAAPA